MVLKTNISQTPALVYKWRQFSHELLPFSHDLNTPERMNGALSDPSRYAHRPHPKAESST